MTSPKQAFDTDLEARRASLAARLASLQDAASRIADQITVVKADLLATTDGPDSYSAGQLTVVVTVAHRLDTKAIESKYPADTHPELYRPALDTAAVRKHIAPVDLEVLTIASAPSVKLS